MSRKLFHQVYEKKVLDHGYVALVDAWGGDEAIVEAARMSTQKGFLGWGPRTEEVISPQGEIHQREVPGDEKLLKYLWDHDHATPFEMAGATFEVQAPIFVLREWHRHRVPFGYNEASARYAPLPDVNYVPTVERLLRGGGHLTKQAGANAGAQPLNFESARDFLDALETFYEQAQDLYEIALDSGVPKELARVCLPVGRYTKMRATGNLRGWLAFLKLREAPNAQEEIRVYANAIREILAVEFPRTLALYESSK